MFIVFLRFGEQKARAAELMAAHKAWLEQGLAAGIFLAVGSIKPGAGGFILASGESEPQLQQRLRQDPFVAEGVVTLELVVVEPNQTDPRLAFLKAG
ncbi:YciI family protein [Halioxenophilus sp. WMMB6]|uniref:YciI family protein n=1 Tax=Halioxenophilus sp. WMMB6 TaxID=3073815 RepID=UPI00295ED414|nr:YciI family protein [Halioxenophilus sp. WMMB6]